MLFLRRLLANNAVRGNCLKFVERRLTDKNVRELVCYEQSQRQVIPGSRSFCTSYKGAECKQEDVDDGMEKESQVQSTEEIFQEISEGDPQKLKALKLLEFEVALMRNGGARVPTTIKKEQWRELLNLSSLHQRKKHLAFLRKNELKGMSELEKKLIRRQKTLMEIEEQGDHYYGLCGQTMFLRVYSKTVNKMLTLRRLARPGVKIVLDFSYAEFMSNINLKACGRQVCLLAHESRCHRFPSQIDFANLGKDDPVRKHIHWLEPDGSNCFQSDVYETSYLNVYDRERLVYLSPHAQENLKFNLNDVYVIGAYVDRGVEKKVSLSRAKDDKIRCAKFPIDNYLDWKRGSKSLPLNLVVRVLLDMAFYNDWDTALKNLPVRCIRNSFDFVD